MEKLFTFLILSSMLIVATTSASTEEIEATKKWIEAYESRNKTPDLTLHFYVQDVLVGPQATVWEVARPNITTDTDFGQVRVVDDLITSGPEATSQALGRAQGMITSSDLKVDAMVINMIFKFEDDSLYKGGSIAVLGRSQILNATRELIVAGGTGVFQMARGYVIATTYSASDDGQGHVTSAVLEYKFNLYQSISVC